MGLLRPAHDYESFNEKLSDSLVDCKLHLLAPFYGRETVDPKSFRWFLFVSGDEAAITSEGIDYAPEGIKDLIRLLQAYGFPIKKEAVDEANMQRDAC